MQLFYDQSDYTLKECLTPFFFRLIIYKHVGKKMKD